MNVQTKNNTKGFTIIEVVLVLAIAGLIFLMVFIALPALQRNQRDTARKNDVSSVAAALTNFSTNNRGTFPSATDLKSALGAASTSAATTTYSELSQNTDNITVVSAPAAGSLTTSVADGTVTVYKGKKCSTVTGNGSFTLVDGTTRQIAVVTRLEGSSNTAFCQEA